MPLVPSCWTTILPMLSIDGVQYFAGVKKLQAEFLFSVVTLLPRDDFFREIDLSTTFTFWFLFSAMVLWVILFSILLYSFWWLQGREDEHTRSTEASRTLHETKTKLLARLSHELRTPLAGIIGLVDILESACIEEEQKANVSVLKKTCTDLMQLLDGMLVLAKNEAGRSNVESNEFDLRDELGNAIINLRGMVADRDIKVRLKYDSSLHDVFVGDRRRLRQIVDNLLSNASKFTIRGTIGISVEARCHDSDEPTQIIDFRVSDTGIGIPKDRKTAVFEEFEQADHLVRVNHGGVGLGLAIVRSLCRLMGGDVEIAHTSPEGTEFHFRTPLGIKTSSAPSPTFPNIPIQAHPLRGLHVLVAEDTKLLSILILRLIEKSGGKCTLTKDGRELLNVYCDSPERFDVILMDVQMPHVDGIEATKEIKKLDGAHSQIPIIALTAHALESDRERCLAAEMSDYVRKPLDKDIIVSTILALVRNGEDD
jgi:signal transduction histidine kinase/ActR/RegA family two-component response regulator